MNMKTAHWIVPAMLAMTAGAAVAAEADKPATPDPQYCSQRDADPAKCVIQDGPPPKPLADPPSGLKFPSPPTIPGGKLPGKP